MRDKYTFLPQAVVPASHNVLVQTIQAVFAQVKGERRAAQDAAVLRQRQEIARVQGLDHPVAPVLHQYEIAHLQAGTAWTGVCALLQREAGRLPNTRLIVNAGAASEYRLFGWVNARFAPVGKVVLGDARFELVAPQPAGLVNQVYQRRERPGRHYVQLPDGSYLRRFLSRGLNQSDSLNLTGNRALEAPEQGAQVLPSERRSAEHTGRHNVPAGTVLSLDQQILSHTRGWKKRFVSATTTSRPVYSTRGEEFRSVFGVVLIDLAHVPLATVVDLHRPDRINARFGVGPQDIVGAPAAEPGYPRTLAHENFLAARDVIRTREVLIQFRVPPAAVVRHSLGNRIIGLSHADRNEVFFRFLYARDVCGRGINIVATEAPEYPWHGRWWYFVEYASAADALRVSQNLRALPDPINSLFFQKFDIPAPPPAGV